MTEKKNRLVQMFHRRGFRKENKKKTRDTSERKLWRGKTAVKSHGTGRKTLFIYKYIYIYVFYNNLIGTAMLYNSILLFSVILLVLAINPCKIICLVVIYSISIWQSRFKIYISFYIWMNFKNLCRWLSVLKFAYRSLA